MSGNLGNTLIYFHQGWTDVVNCLPLIDYYLSTLPQVYVLMRIDAKDFFDYYIRGKNVIPIYRTKSQLDQRHFGVDLSGFTLLFHGMHDSYRNDAFRGAYNMVSPPENFAQFFYEPYGIDSVERVASFNLIRDLEAEDQALNAFIQEHGTEYSLYHDDAAFPLLSQLDMGIKWVSLTGVTKNPFVFTQVINQAKAIHVMDSFWGTVMYLMDARYRVFQHKRIVLHLFRDEQGKRSYTRGGGCVVNQTNGTLQPVSLPNWEIK